MTIQQLSIFLENKPGRLAEAIMALSVENIQIKALSLVDNADFGVLRIITNEAEKAKNILKQQSFSAQLSPILAVAIPNKKLALAEILKQLDDNSLNVEYMYPLCSMPKDLQVIFLKLNDPELGIEIIKKGIGQLISINEL